MSTDSPGFWNETWAEVEASGSGSDEILVEQVEHLTPGRSLEVGCGMGENAVWLAAGGWLVTAVDYSVVGIHKGELLALLRAAADALTIDRTDAAAVWQAALGRLEADPLFPRDKLDGLRAADVRWATTEPASRGAQATPVNAVCRCGSTTWRDTPIHGGQSIRRDCGGCQRFLSFPIWHGEAEQGGAIAEQVFAEADQPDGAKAQQTEPAQ